MDKEEAAFLEEGKKRFAHSPAGKWRWNCDGGRMIFFDMRLILRRNGTGSYEGYTKRTSGEGYTEYRSSFLWEPQAPFSIRVKPEGDAEWYILNYELSVRQKEYTGLTWVICWSSPPKWPSGKLEGFAEEFDWGWGDLKDEEY